MPTKHKRIDLSRIIARLIEEKKRLDLVIASLEGLNDSVELQGARAEEPVRRRRGRKSMSLEERRVVSERMRLYWRSRKAMRDPAGSDAMTPPARAAEGRAH